MFCGVCLNICHCWKWWFSYNKLKFIILEFCAVFVCTSLLTARQDSVVSITICIGLHGPGIESRWGEIFHTCPLRPWDLRSLLYKGYRCSSPGVKWPGCGVDHPPHPAPRLKEKHSYTSTHV